MTAQNATLTGAAAAVLAAAEPGDKVAAAREALKLLNDDSPLGETLPPLRPARPSRPALTAPGSVPRRRLGSPEGRIALLHAVAHIEFNAIDLAFDMAARFHGAIAEARLDARAFIFDWIRIGEEEARHFSMVEARLSDYGAAYGDLPAHDGLWEAAGATAHDVAARLAIAPMILEARGLDVTPGMIDRLRAAGDEESCAVLEVIYRDEIGHVACGDRWFHAICKARGEDPIIAFRGLKDRFFSGGLKPPFNHAARDAAGLDRRFYEESAADDPN